VKLNVGFFSVEVPLNPKYHKLEVAFVLLSVNVTFNGAFPEVEDAMNEAFGRPDVFLLVTT
jgi:hypothetical protein